eukprot:gnl/TRDRNA2_/TRDRNA2_90335_c0_seq1.p1 gnl/TRDRNA2_/TRDRNA2_90335_c0~~gnl/TRDRNA2_/TRDRNA2_90335_c0_seq1.p1  ORF type:complete len:197 (+),score=29.65 gnl/TRDRNA2_/TRDRNA2_90335_c0_seq1:64-654(+)
MAASETPSVLPGLIVFDLDACLWTPEMYELRCAPTQYDEKRGGVAAGSETVRLFPGAAAVLRRIRTDGNFASCKIAVASSTTEPAYAATCLESLPVKSDKKTTISDMVHHRQIYPGSKGRQHFPALLKDSGIPYDQMLFFDDCTYGDNCGDVARCCPGTTCVRTPDGLTEELFDAGLAAFASGKRGVLDSCGSRRR